MFVIRPAPAIFTALLASSIIAGGCADPTPSPDEESTEQAATVEEVADDEKTQDESPEITLEEVHWEDAEDHGHIAVERLSEQAQSIVGDSPVPVLLPDDDQLLGSLHLTLGDAWYASSMQGDGHSVAINGTHLTHPAPGAGGAKEGDDPRPEGHLLTRTHGIVTLAFEQFGVAYAIDVECENPMENEICAKDEYVISLAENAAVVGDSE